MTTTRRLDRQTAPAPEAPPSVTRRLILLPLAGAGLVVILSWLLASPLPVVAGCLALVGVSAVALRRARRRMREQLEWVSVALRTVADDPSLPFEPPADPALADVAASLRRVRRELNAAAPVDSSSELGIMPTPSSLMTHSGLYDAPAFERSLEASSTGETLKDEIILRLEPAGLRWLDASAAAQAFLGWRLDALRRMSFLDIVHPEHRDLAREQLHASLSTGESHGLIYRVKTAAGATRAVEMNVSVRYGPDRKITHLRCHLTDVTAKLQASRELRRRTRELAAANEELREINRELAELKDRYGDLYQNAPAMYYSVDVEGNLTECNDTLLRTLGFTRDQLLGQPYTTLLRPEDRPSAVANQARFMETGRIEMERRWIKADGRPIDVWISGTAVRGPDGKFLHSRTVAQDITARLALEAELREKNDRLACANEELRRKNKELDEFTYVVSHDLQEPLRTLTAFSDFLLKDCSESLGAEGQEYVRYLVDASRRMRALIDDLLSLSRAGRIIGDWTQVDVGEVVDLVRADLAELIRAKGAEVRVTGPLPRVWGDRNRIGQLLGNLIGNGLKYNTSVPPVVEIGAVGEPSGGMETFRVSDNGIGIDPQFHAKIFQLFRRLHTREEYDGTGAGLAICQKIAQAHGGRLWVESEPGRGSTFFLTLPRITAEAPQARDDAHHV